MICLKLPANSIAAKYSNFLKSAFYEELSKEFISQFIVFFCVVLAFFHKAVLWLYSLEGIKIKQFSNWEQLLPWTDTSSFPCFPRVWPPACKWIDSSLTPKSSSTFNLCSFTFDSTSDFFPPILLHFSLSLTPPPHTHSFHVTTICIILSDFLITVKAESPYDIERTVYL